ncbi:MAG TPA: hypothetical protein VF331_28595 [Polyangiales bacterium]
MRQLTWLFGLQATLWLAAFALILWRARLVLVTASADRPAFLAALRVLLEQRDLPAAQTLASSLQPAWVAHLSCAALAAWSEPAAVRSAIEESIAELELDLSRYVFAIRTLGRIASPIAFVCAIAQMSLGFRKDLGLLALQRGLAESIAIERAILCVVAGVATSLLCRAGAALLHKHERALHGDIAATAELLLHWGAPEA